MVVVVFVTADVGMADEQQQYQQVGEGEVC